MIYIKKKWELNLKKFKSIINKIIKIKIINKIMNHFKNKIQKLIKKVD